MKDWKFYFCSFLDVIAWGFLSFGSAMLVFTALTNGKVKNIGSDGYSYFTEEPYFFILMTLIKFSVVIFSSCILIFSLNDIVTFSQKLYKIDYLRKYRAYQINKICSSKFNVIMLVTLLVLGVAFYVVGTYYQSLGL